MNGRQRGKRKALMLTGARQIGKTTLVREYAKHNYDCFVEINFLARSDAAKIFSGALDARTIIENLTAYTRKPLVPGKTLILLDEIQECPAARTAIKFLVEDGRYGYVETGSLLGVKTREVSSYPVGFEQRCRMYPMDFEEFCLANGVQDETLSMLHECFEDKRPVSDSVHQTMMRLYAAYLVVGGMPEVVQRYVETNDIAQVIELQNDLLELYRQDIAKYAEARDQTKIRSIFDAIPAQLDDKNRRFILADLGKSARSERYESSFLWLADAGVALPCYNVQEPAIPLAGNEKRSLFKLFMGDVGLLCAASMGDVQLSLLNGDLDANAGSIMENVVAQELVAHGFGLRYYNSKRYGELDFVVQRGTRALPIEVKSGNDWRHHKALNNALAVEEWGLGEGVVFCKGNVKVDGAVTYLPLYMTMFLDNSKPKEMKYQIDLSALK